MHSMILQRIPLFRHILYFVSPIHFKDRSILGQDIPTKSGTDTGEGVGEIRVCRNWRGTVVAEVPTVPDINKWRELKHRFAAGPAPQWEARFDRKEEHVITQQCDLTITADGISSTHGHLLEGEQRGVREL